MGVDLHKKVGGPRTKYKQNAVWGIRSVGLVTKTSSKQIPWSVSI